MIKLFTSFPRTLGLLGLLSLAPLSHGAPPPINFTVAKIVDSSNEGPDRTRSYITMGDRKIAFEQPAKTEMDAVADSLALFFVSRGLQGQLKVVNSRLPADLDFISGVQTYFEAAEGSLPKEAKEVEAVGSDYKVYAVSSRTCLALDWKYTLYGRLLHHRVAYVNVDPQHQVCLTVISSEEDWKGSSSLVRGFMNSWFFADDVRGRDVAGSH